MTTKVRRTGVTAMPSDRIEPPFICPGCGTKYDTSEAAARCYGTEPPSDPPWENPDGSTNVDGWLTAYAKDDNIFWRTEQGHIMNVVDELIARLDDG